MDQVKETAKQTSDYWTNGVGPDVMAELFWGDNLIRVLKLCSLEHYVSQSKGRIAANISKLFAHCGNACINYKDCKGLQDAVINELSFLSLDRGEAEAQDR